MGRLSYFSAALAAACLLSFFLPGLVPGVLGALSLGAFFLLPRLAVENTRLRWLAAGLCFGFLWSVGYSVLIAAPAKALENRSIRLEATVAEWPSETPYGVSVLVRGNEKGKRPVAMTIKLGSEYRDLKPGDRIACVAHCTSSSQRYGQAQHHRAKGIYLFAKAYGAVTVHAPDTPPLRYAPLYLAKELRALIHRLYPEEQASFLESLVTGYTGNLDPITKQAFSRTGLSHVVSVSGMHVSFLSGLLLLLLGKGKKLTAAIQILLIFFFAAMTGNAPGALRAAVLCSVALIAPFFRRRSDALTALFTALFFLLLLSPVSIANAGLQFSFAATLGIYLLGQPLHRLWMKKLDLHKYKRLLSVPLSLLAVSLGVNLFTIPLSVLYFGQASLISPIANLLTNWAVALSFLGGILSLALGAIWLPLGALAAAVVSFPLSAFLWLAEQLSRLPFAAVQLDSIYYQLFFVFLYALVALYLFWWRKGRRRPVLPVCAAVTALCTCLLLTNLSARRNDLTMSVLDVGQGQSIALLSGGQRALIDCGGSKQAGSVAAAYFYNLGYSKLDLLILTHYHDDHANGGSELFEQLDIGAVALPDTDADSAQRAELEALALEHGAELWYINTESLIPLGNARLTVYPPISQKRDSEAGLSILCAVGRWEALVTGDMGSGLEAKLIAQYNLPDIELLVLGHHGSKYSNSESLLHAVTPDFAAVSVGNNSYGHPAPETLARLEELDIPVYRTDLMGTVTITLGD